MPHKFVMQPEFESQNSTFVEEHVVNFASKTNPDRIIFKNQKIEVRGKFFFQGEEKFYIKGVTYGAFEPDKNGQEYFDKDKIDADFAMMAQSGFNTVRIPHTTPPRYLLDIAHKHNLKVMIGLSAEQYVGYLIDKKKANDIYGDIRKKVRKCADHPALLCIAIGNEISASIVRLIGRKKIEKYLKEVYDIVKKEAPDSIVTYVNYPTTEYLQLPFLDLLCFNVYLESPDKLENYLARLQNIAGNRPLMLGEVGLDSIRNGTEKQSELLDWQIKIAFKMGCAGLFIFSWTDEWYRGGEEVHDWAFGLTDKQRLPKPALNTVIQAFQNIPEKTNKDWPFMSVVVCTHNGSKTISECLNQLLKINYSNYEVIVVNDGSTDNTETIVAQFPFRVISTENNGLSYARNIGGNAANGEIIVYVDDDAIPDVDWLAYLGMSYMTTDFAAIGGPNIAPLNSSFIADCVDHAPGSPTHVLISDRDAEHIPGCNLSVRKEVFDKIGGFDSQFRVAGDDVDLCWRIEEGGWKIGFNAAAMVWHHRRSSIKSYWKQQLGYGKAEALLERKWPQKYNNLGHKTWTGRIYNNASLSLPLFRSWRIYHGVWGNEPFQSIYGSSRQSRFSFLLMPEWYLLSFIILLAAIGGISWSPWKYLAPLALIVSVLPFVQIIYYVGKLPRYGKSKKNAWYHDVKWRVTTTLLHIIQPFARLLGRMKFNLTPWRRFGKRSFALPIPKNISIWCESWLSPEYRLNVIESDLCLQNAYVERGGVYARWDLKIKGGVFGSFTLLMAAEDHKNGCQLLRFRFVPKLSKLAIFSLSFLAIILAIVLLDGFWIAGIIFGLTFFNLLIRIFGDFGRAYSSLKFVVLKQDKLK